MKTIDLLCDELEAIWHEKIPLSQAMALGIDSFDRDILISRARFAPNVNVHGTAFAGSLYSVQALTGWGMIWLQLQLAGFDASIVLASGNIEYMKPLKEDLITRCDFNGLVDSIAVLETNDKARFELTCSVSGQDGVASEFVGNYAVKLNR